MAETWIRTFEKQTSYPYQWHTHFSWDISNGIYQFHRIRILKVKLDFDWELRGSRIPSAILVACFGVTFGVKALRVAVRLGPEPWVLAWDDWRSISNWFPSRKHLSDEIGSSLKTQKSITNMHKHHTSIFRILNIEYRHTESAHITDRA